MKRLLTTAATLAVLATCSGALAPGQEKPAKADDKASIWMKAKLKFSQDILDGLTRADFDKVRTNASAMAFAGYLEKWAKADNKEYKRQMALFEFANEELVSQANAKNVEGATLAYNQLTVSCIQCHRVVRDVKN